MHSKNNTPPQVVNREQSTIPDSPPQLIYKGTPRPKIDDDNVIQAAAKRLLPEFRGLCADSTTDEELLEALATVLERPYADGYERAKQLEDDGWSVDFELCEFLNDISALGEYRQAVKEWVNASGITCPVTIGDLVEFEGNPGAIVAIYPEHAEVVVCVEALGHVRGQGVNGRILTFEKVAELRKPRSATPPQPGTVESDSGAPTS